MRSICLFLVGACVACAPVLPAPTLAPDTGRRLVAEHGMVVSANPYASDAGLEMLKRGGNAVDAAVAAAFAIGVVEPMMSGLGAGGGMLIWRQRADSAQQVDFRAVARGPFWDLRRWNAEGRDTFLDGRMKCVPISANEVASNPNL